MRTLMVASFVVLLAGVALISWGGEYYQDYGMAKDQYEKALQEHAWEKAAELKKKVDDADSNKAIATNIGTLGAFLLAAGILIIFFDYFLIKRDKLLAEHRKEYRQWAFLYFITCVVCGISFLAIHEPITGGIDGLALGAGGFFFLFIIMLPVSSAMNK